MKIDDFFASVDSTLRKTSEAETASNEKAAENYELLQEVVARLAPVVSSYMEKLKERNINADVQNSPASLSLTLRYSDGGHRGLSINRSLKTNEISITSSFTNDDGKNYTSTNGTAYDKSNWKDDVFVEQLHRCIEDFLIYANRHGGI